MRPKVTVEIHPLEIEGNAVEVGSECRLKIQSHWTWGDRVDLILNGNTYTIIGEDLKRAVDSCLNVRRT